ncbi:MAG: hypothetical protein WBG96_16665, partial [Thermoanaerobaculia bacterium]
MKRTGPPPAAATVSVRSRAESPLLDKCAQFTRAHEMEALGLYPYFKEISDSEDTVVTIEGR